MFRLEFPLRLGHHLQHDRNAVGDIQTDHANRGHEGNGRMRSAGIRLLDDVVD
ncbi:hypothetical protein D3C87_2070010 [compost metagenome]